MTTKAEDMHAIFRDQWKYDPGSHWQYPDDPQFWGHIDAGGTRIVVTADTLDELNRVRAGIAAAPELLAACEALIGDNNPPAGTRGHIDLNQAVAMARAAIAKARGE